MIREENYCLRCNFNHPNNFPRIKFRQDAGCPLLAKYGYIFRKDVTASEKVVDLFNKQFTKMTYQDWENKPVAKRIYDSSSSYQVSAIQVHSPSISKSTLDSTVPPAPIENNVLLMPNHVAPTPTSNGYNISTHRIPTMTQCSRKWLIVKL